MRGTVFQQGVRYAEYNNSGMLHSWWRKPTGEKNVKYLEKMQVFQGRAFSYDSEFNDPSANEETDGWPAWLPADLKPKPKRRERVKAEDLLS
jgi:hypothetical protein